MFEGTDSMFNTSLKGFLMEILQNLKFTQACNKIPTVIIVSNQLLNRCAGVSNTTLARHSYFAWIVFAAAVVVSAVSSTFFSFLSYSDLPCSHPLLLS